VERVAACLVVLLGGATLASAADVHVDPDHGSDQADGLAAEVGAGGPGTASHGPVRSLARGVALLQAGDVLHLAARAEPYHESLNLHNISGTPEMPIIIDGHGATITGTEPLDPREWREVGEGRYVSATLYAARTWSDFQMQRMFFVVDGAVQRMGRTSKGAKAPWKKPEDLQPGEWTFDVGSKAFTIRLAPGRAIAASGFEIPVRLNGVAINGTHNANVVIRHLTVTRVINDGFNLHEHAQNVRLEHIAAYDCGDDGFSAHEHCQASVVGFRASRNSTGFTNGFSSAVTLDGGIIADNYAYEVMQGEDSTFAIRNTVITALVSRAMRLRGDAKLPTPCRGTYEHVLIDDRSGVKLPACDVGAHAVLTARQVTTINASWVVEGEVRLSDSVLAADTATAALTMRGTWSGERNVFGLGQYVVGGTDVGADVAAFFRAQPSEVGSRAEVCTPAVLAALRASNSPFAPAGAHVESAP
jgi:hypothetical protein